MFQRLGVLFGVVVLLGCRSPLTATVDEQLREQLLATQRAYRKAMDEGPYVQVKRAPSEVEQKLEKENRIEELDKMSGLEALRHKPLELGEDLLGREKSDVLTISLQTAVEQAIRYNIDLKSARYLPAIAQSQVTQAMAVFDAEFFVNFDWTKIDDPQGIVGGGVTETTAMETGVRKQLSSGGQVQLTTSFQRVSQTASPFLPPLFYDANIDVSVTQPLLRNLGTDVNRAQIVLSQNAENAAVEELRRAAIETALGVERQYWALVNSIHRLRVQNHLYKMTVIDWRTLKEREGFDVSPVRLTQAASFVEIRRGEVIRARQQVRIESDRLKRLIGSPDLPITGETLLLPVDEPPTAPVEFSLYDAVMTALKTRPEMKQALLGISDASVRQRIADNQRLPQLDLTAAIGYNGSDDGLGGASGTMLDGDFIDYIIGVDFSVPIGNRGPEAFYRQRQIERQQAVVDYRREAQDVVLEVKEAMRQLMTAYELIGAARASRRAAADNVRAIQVQMDEGVKLTPEFLLDQKLNAQERLADAEIQEMEAMTTYNTSIANLYRSMGTLLQRNRIEFDPRPPTDRQ